MTDGREKACKEALVIWARWVFPTYVESAAVTLRFLSIGPLGPMNFFALTTCERPSDLSNTMLVELKRRLVANQQHTQSTASGEAFPQHGHGRSASPRYIITTFNNLQAQRNAEHAGNPARKAELSAIPT